MKIKANHESIYCGDSLRVRIKDYEPFPQTVPYGMNVQGIYFDGYPQLIKQEGSQPIYSVKAEKDTVVPLRDGVRLAVDIYRPDIEGKTFPAILAMGWQGKELQEMVRWWPKPQPYYDSPFWDGMMEAGNIDYVVSRGYIHVIPEPRNRGKSEGYASVFFNPQDTYDIIEWIAAQPWSDGNVGMMGPSSYSITQMEVAQDPPRHLKAIEPDESPVGTGDQFHGIYDCLTFAIGTGRHGNDSGHPPDNTLVPPTMLSLPKEELERRLQEALHHPDIRYNSKFYSLLKYPMREPLSFDSLLSSFHPRPLSSNIKKITIPTWLGTPWVTRLYIWGCFEAYENISTPQANKKLTVYPPSFPDRPFVQYHDETIRWYDYWLKGTDTGVMDEPPIKLFVMGVNKWRFENEWPLARTKWTKFYLHPKGRLSAEPARDGAEPDTFTQPAPYLDPNVYCLRYRTIPFRQDTEITGPAAFYLEASIDQDDTNWMVDLVDVDSKGNRQLLSVGYLKAAYRAIDESKSKPYQPVHPRRDPGPVTPGKIYEYAIALMPTSNVFKAGHSLEIIIRNQDDILSRLGAWGVYMLPFMRTVMHKIHFGKSYLLLPVIPNS